MSESDEGASEGSEADEGESSGDEERTCGEGPLMGGATQPCTRVRNEERCRQPAHEQRANRAAYQ